MSLVGCTELRIGATEAGLLQLRYRGIPDPDEWTFQPYSVVRTAGTGQTKSYGFPTASWSWQALDQASLNVFFSFFAADSDSSVQVYISTYTDTGRKRTTTDYTAYMQRPVDGEGKSMHSATVGNVFRNVAINFTHLEAV